MHTSRRIIYKKRDGRVTQSQAHPLYSLDHCVAGKASERTGNLLSSVINPPAVLVNDKRGTCFDSSLYTNIYPDRKDLH
jgi:hypothetical protein